MTRAVTSAWRNISKQSPSESSTSMKITSALFPGVRSQSTVSLTEPVVPTIRTSGKCWVSARARFAWAIISSSTISTFILQQR